MENPNILQIGQEITVPEKKHGRFVTTYIVKRGDWVSKIADAKCSGVDAIVDANPQIKDKDLIYPKQVFDLPVKKQSEWVGTRSHQGGHESAPHKHHAQSGGQEHSEPSGSFVSPLESCVITSGFGYRHNPVSGANSFHEGVDLAAPIGTRVKSIGSGVVEFAGWNGVYGNQIVIDHPGPIDSKYGHLSAINVHAGEYVTSQELIGRVGNTGWSTGPHLHLQIEVNNTPKNPLGWIPNPC